MTTLIFVDEAIVTDNRIYEGLKDLQGYINPEYNFQNLIMSNVSEKNSSFMVEIGVCEELDMLISDVGTVVDTNRRQFSKSDIKVFQDIMKLSRETENDHRTFFTAKAEE